MALLTFVPSASIANVFITVSRAEQTMTVLVEPQSGFDPSESRTWNVSTGQRRHITPSGSFVPTMMSRMLFSNKYERARMPFAVCFLPRNGSKCLYAIHAATGGGVRLLGYPVSHGCVRIAPKNARWLYDIVKKHGLKRTTIMII